MKVVNHLMVYESFRSHVSKATNFEGRRCTFVDMEQTAYGCYKTSVDDVYACYATDDNGVTWQVGGTST